MLPDDAPVMVSTREIVDAFHDKGSGNIVLIVLSDEKGLSPGRREHLPRPGRQAASGHAGRGGPAGLPDDERTARGIHREGQEGLVLARQPDR